jgi:hypothetical protein
MNEGKIERPVALAALAALAVVLSIEAFGLSRAYELPDAEYREAPASVMNAVFNHTR